MNIREYMEGTNDLIKDFPQIAIVNWVAVDECGEVYGFKYKPDYYANGWSQNIKHPECKVYDVYFGTLDKKYIVDLESFKSSRSIKKLAFRINDILNTHRYNYDSTLYHLLDEESLGNVIHVITNIDDLGDLNEWWVCTDNKNNSYLCETQPIVKGDSFEGEGVMRYIGTHKYIKRDNWSEVWSISPIRVIDIYDALNRKYKASRIVKEELATKVIPVDSAIASIDQQISNRKYQIAKLESEISSLEIAKNILSN